MTGTEEDEREKIRNAGEAVGNAVIEWLHALTRRGYLAKMGLEGGITFILLEHPTGPDLTIWGDGQLIVSDPTSLRDKAIIEFDDRAGFERFLGTVKEASIFTRLKRATVADVFITALVWGFFLGFGLIASMAFSAVARWWQN
jgi:predicted secreted protein